MGWASRNRFASSIDSDVIKQQTDALFSSGTAAAGHRYVNLDDGWWQGDRNADGSIAVDADLRRPNTGMERHYQQDLETFQRWCFDYVKIDWRGGWWRASARRPRSTPDLVNRLFAATRPNQLRVADLAYLRTRSGWVYVASATWWSRVGTRVPSTISTVSLRNRRQGWSASNGPRWSMMRSAADFEIPNSGANCSVRFIRQDAATSRTRYSSGRLHGRPFRIGSPPSRRNAVIGLMGIVCVSLYVIFKRRDWL